MYPGLPIPKWHQNGFLFEAVSDGPKGYHHNRLLSFEQIFRDLELFRQP